MSTSYDLDTVQYLVTLSSRCVEEIRSQCKDQRMRLNLQRKILQANRAKRLAREAKQKGELRELYGSLGPGKRVE